MKFVNKCLDQESACNSDRSLTDEFLDDILAPQNSYRSRVVIIFRASLKTKQEGGCMVISKVFLVPSEDPRSADVRGWFPDERFKLVKRPGNAEFIVVAGGDGAMLMAIPKYCRIGIPFFGINRGTRGCLLNEIRNADELALVLEKKLDIIPLRLLNATFYKINGKHQSYLAFNDVFLKAESGAIVQGVIRGERYREKEFRGDGIIVSTAQGSTAYNRSAGGSILPLNSNHLAVCTICASPEMHPIREGVNPQRLEIEITRGKATGHADTRQQRVANVERVVIAPSTFEVRLAFDPDMDFETARYKVN